MRTAYESLTALRACIAELDPVLVKTTLHDNVRAGLPGSSVTDGRGSSEPAVPGSGTLTDNDADLSLFDATDQQLLATAVAYDQALDQLATAALTLRKAQRDVLYRELLPVVPILKSKVYADLKLDPAGQPHTKPEWCLSCARIRGNLSPVADEKRGGKDCTLCRWCLEYTREHNQKWPPLEMIEARAQGRPVRVKVKPS